MRTYIMKKTRFNLVLITALLLSVSNIFSQTEDSVTFEFKQKEGENNSYISIVEEEAYKNGNLNNHAEIINRISTIVKKDYPDGSADLYTSYMTTTNTLLNGSNKNLSWGEESSVDVTRQKSGELTIPYASFMPTVRNVPVFPKTPVKKGQTWSAKGMEVHDVRELFHMKTPIVIPFVATYKYTRDETVNGTVFHVIEVYYEFSNINSKSSIAQGSLYASTTGFSKQTLFWDSNRGVLDHYYESFKIQMKDIYGNRYLFQGTAHAEITEFKSVNDDNTIKELQDTVNDLNLDNITIKKGDKGLTISIENIQFEPDSNILLDSEKAKLKKIAEILRRYKNDLLITGHCADRGTFNARQQLSEERAQSVASYLKELGVRDDLHMFTKGLGATQPIATNNTEEGRAKNRRVEITLMD